MRLHQHGSLANSPNQAENTLMATANATVFSRIRLQVSISQYYRPTAFRPRQRTHRGSAQRWTNTKSGG